MISSIEGFINFNSFTADNRSLSKKSKDSFSSSKVFIRNEEDKGNNYPVCVFNGWSVAKTATKQDETDMDVHLSNRFFPKTMNGKFTLVFALQIYKYQQ